MKSQSKLQVPFKVELPAHFGHPQVSIPRHLQLPLSQSTVCWLSQFTLSIFTPQNINGTGTNQRQTRVLFTEGLGVSFLSFFSRLVWSVGCWSSRTQLPSVTVCLIVISHGCNEYRQVSYTNLRVPCQSLKVSALGFFFDTFLQGLLNNVLAFILNL